jgi:hypothetical protein
VIGVKNQSVSRGGKILFSERGRGTIIDFGQKYRPLNF